MISIEALVPERFGDVAAWLSRPEVNRWLTSEWRGRAVDATALAILVRNRRNRAYLVSCDGAACGLVALAEIDAADGLAMIWYVLGDPEFAGRGVTTEGVRLVAKNAFDELGLSCVYAWIMEDNTASRRVLEKAGFREAGRLRNAATSKEGRVDRIYFDLLAAQ
jgi:RimJ/RimL family protein N-acetyltransferase